MHARRFVSHPVAMEQRLILHIVDGDSRSRAEQARTAFALSHHAEVYSDLDELLDRPPLDGAILLRQRAMDVPLAELFERLAEHGIWLPVIVCAEDPQLERVVGAIKSGALDFIEKPFRGSEIVARLDEAIGAYARRQAENASPKFSSLHFPGREPLTRREREVLEQFASGASNKEAGRTLGISPRTIEDHRANIMKKLGARNAADLVRIVMTASRNA